MWLLIFLLFASPAAALEFKEQSVTCRSLYLYRDDDGKPYAIANCESFTTDGSSLASFNLNLLPLMSGAQRSCLSGIANDIHRLVREARSMPSPTPTSIPTGPTPTVTPVPTAQP